MASILPSSRKIETNSKRGLEKLDFLRRRSCGETVPRRLNRRTGKGYCEAGVQVNTVKLNLLTYLLLALPAAGQSANWHGMKAGAAQAVELEPERIVRFETWAEKLGRSYVVSVYALSEGVEHKAQKTTVRRVIRDNFNLIEVRYALTLEEVPGGRGYYAVFEDLPPPEKQGKGWTFLGPTGRPVPQQVQVGETLKLVLYSGASGPNLTEYIRISAPDREALQEEPARDSYQAGAEFTIARPKLKANGQPAGMEPVADLHAPLLRVRIPGFGSFVLSLEPHPGFEEAGEVSGNLLVFQNHGNIFRIDCAERIASGSAKYNVYARLNSISETAPPGAASIVAEQVQ